MDPHLLSSSLLLEISSTLVDPVIFRLPLLKLPAPLFPTLDPFARLLTLPQLISGPFLMEVLWAANAGTFALQFLGYLGR
jgi:hypothetical protein